MDYKLLTLFLLIVIVNLTVHGHHGKDPGHYRKKKLEEKCGTDKTCIAAAEKCLGDKDAKPPANDKMTDSEKLAAFNKCLESHGKGADVLSEQNCAKKSGNKSEEVQEKREEDEEETEGRSGRHEKCKKEKIDYLRDLQNSRDAASGKIRCCYFQAIGVEMVNSNNSINLNFFRQHLKDRISNQGVLDEYEGAFKACLPRGDMCNVHGFRECVMDECISRMQKS
ncbi:UNVERIFIED_CONTAM: hypothetical protein RMT77_018750 [Armadillidium vulgare]